MRTRAGMIFLCGETTINTWKNFVRGAIQRDWINKRALSLRGFFLEMRDNASLKLIFGNFEQSLKIIFRETSNIVSSPQSRIWGSEKKRTFRFPINRLLNLKWIFLDHFRHTKNPTGLSLYRQNHYNMKVKNKNIKVRRHPCSNSIYVSHISHILMLGLIYTYIPFWFKMRKCPNYLKAKGSFKLNDTVYMYNLFICNNFCVKYFQFIYEIKLKSKPIVPFFVYLGLLQIN